MVAKRQKQYIWFGWTTHGQHYYPGHPILQTPHAHPFQVLVRLETFDDRQIEFLEFRDKIRRIFESNYPPSVVFGLGHVEKQVLNFKDSSCEKLAGIVADIIDGNLPDGYPEADVDVSITEGDELAGAVWIGVVRLDL